MQAITLDTNCLIDLEVDGQSAAAVRSLVGLQEARQIELRLPAICASENPRAGRPLTNFREFQSRVERAGLRGVRLLEPIGYWDLTFWDYCVWPDDDMLRLERKIHEILFPSVEYEYAEFCRARGLAEAAPIDRRWRNAKCDVLVAWSHTYYGGDVLVTNDRRFHQPARKAALGAVGCGGVVRPVDAVRGEPSGRTRR